MKSHTNKSLALLTVFTLVSGSCFAATAINYDFNSDATDGSNPAGWFDSSTWGSSSAVLDVQADTNDWFEQGTSNKVARYTETDTGDNGIAYVDFTPDDGNDFFTITFDYYIDSSITGASDDANTALGDSDLNSSTRRFANSGAPSTLNALTTTSFLVNASGASKSYFNPVTNSVQSLADGSSASFDYNHGSGTVTARTSTSVGISYSSVDKFGFKTSSSPTAVFYFDDVVLNDDQLFVAVPESSAALFVGLSALLMLRRRRVA